MKIEVSAHNGDQTIEGVTEPIISQRVIEQSIQLHEGEPSVLAGILQKQDSRTVSGTPGLGEIPLLKYFFSTQGKEQQSDEIVFLLIPHIVRSSILTDDMVKPVYTGTSQSIELIHNAAPPAPTAVTVTAVPAMGPPSGQTTSAAYAANAAIGQIAAQARPPVPNAAVNAAIPAVTAPVRTQPALTSPNTAGTAATGPISLTVVPPTVNQTVGATFQVALRAANAHDLASVPVQLHFDPKVLSLVNVDAGDLLGRDGQAVALMHRVDDDGTVTISASRPPNLPGVEGQGTVCTLTFKALSIGDATLSLVKMGAKDSQQNALPAIGGQATVHVK
jgi:general secretion pathway protein D